MPDTGEVAAWISNGTQLTVPVQDRIGSTVGLVGSSGALATQYQYEPYGKASSSGQASVYPYQFAGTEQDTGLYHLQYRFYSPGLARFISQDPLGVSGSGVNLFAYANDDPVNEVDPLGMDSYCNGDCAGGETNQNPQGGGGFPSLFSSIIGFFEDLCGGGSGTPSPSEKDYLGKRHAPMVILVGTEEDIGPNQHDMVQLPGKTTPERPQAPEPAFTPPPPEGQIVLIADVPHGQPNPRGGAPSPGRPSPPSSPGYRINLKTFLLCMGAAAAFNPGPFVGCPVGVLACSRGIVEGCAQALGSCSTLGGIGFLCGGAAWSR
jgi:RHS repeat-associated protein